MKKLSLFFVLLTLILVAISPASVAAQTSILTATPTAQPSQVGTNLEPPITGDFVYTFSDLGVNDRTLNGPFDSQRIRFSFPLNWKLNTQSKIQLHLAAIYTSPNGIDQQQLIESTGGTIAVFYNSIWISTIVLDWKGEKVINIPITARALNAAVSNVGQNYITLSLNASIDCQYHHKTIISVMSDSRIQFAHDDIYPALNLSNLPFPIYQDNSFVPTNNPGTVNNNLNGPGIFVPVAIITSDSLNESELRATMIVSAGLGHLSKGKLPITILPVSQLTDDIKKGYHLIFVGKGEGFSLLSGVKLPAPYDGKSFTADSAKPDDGIIQESISPFDPSKIILVISGNSDAGIIKAAQGFSSGVIITTSRPDLALVSTVTSAPDAQKVPDDRTLADLGYSTVQLSGVGAVTQNYNFFIPSGQTLKSNDSYFKISYLNSSMLDFDTSVINVFLNGFSIGGSRLTEEASKSLATVQLVIPRYLLRTGMNTLTVEADHQVLNYCSVLQLNNLWTSISDQSVLHLPLAPSEIGNFKNFTLADGMNILSTSPTLGTTAFVVAPGSSAAINSAGQIANQLGAGIFGSLVDLKAVYADKVPDDLRKNNDLVLVGRASQMPIISELGKNLPAGFAKGSDNVDETAFQVVYRIVPNVSIGYLELINSPWNPIRSIIAVMGTTDDGLAYSANALFIPAMQRKLIGNFAVVRNDQVISSDTRYGMGTGNLSATMVPGVPQVTAIPTIASAGAKAPQPQNVPFAYQKGWILPVLVLLVLLLVLVLIYALIGMRKK